VAEEEEEEVRALSVLELAWRRAATV